MKIKTIVNVKFELKSEKRLTRPLGHAITLQMLRQKKKIVR